MDRQLAIDCLTARGLLVLAEIAGEPVLSQAALAARLGLRPSTISEQLRRLEGRGLVRRSRPESPQVRGAGPVGSRRRDAAPRDPERPPGRPPRVPALTEAGALVLAEAARKAARLEREWGDRLARSGRSPWPLARAEGLRRWLLESRAALQARPAGRPARPCRLRRAGARPAPGRR